jgi:hypothetical protein
MDDDIEYDDYYSLVELDQIKDKICEAIKADNWSSLLKAGRQLVAIGEACERIYKYSLAKKLSTPPKNITADCELLLSQGIDPDIGEISDWTWQIES